MQKNDLIRLRHMLDAALEATQFAAGRSRSDLDENRMLVLCLVKEIEIIGEAAGRVSPETQKSLPELPWPDIVAMRNRLIHAYHDVNLDLVWDTITHDLPPLIVLIRRAIEQS